jgi:hypothetical protein
MRLNLSFSPWSECVRPAVVCVLLSGLLAGCGGGESQAWVPAPAAPPIIPGPDPLLARQWHLFNTAFGPRERPLQQPRRGMGRCPWHRGGGHCRGERRKQPRWTGCGA